MINPISQVNPIYLLFEFITYALFVACLWHAARQHGRHRVLELVFTLLYGVLLEWLTIRQLAAYRYGQFLIMIDDAPLVIGMGWAVIIYSAMEFTSRLRMPDMARPLFDALLALNIDLSMDAIAIRLMDGVTPGQGMWHWGAITTQNAEWFGVPGPTSGRGSSWSRLTRCSSGCCAPGVHMPCAAGCMCRWRSGCRCSRCCSRTKSSVR